MTERLENAGTESMPATATEKSFEANQRDYPRKSISLPNIPLVHPDQILDSIVALAGIHNGLQIGREAIGRILGSPNIKTDRAFHAGFLRAYEALRKSGYDSYDEFAQSHGFLPFFKPFVPATVYTQAVAKQKSNEVAGLAQLLGAGNVTMQHNAYRHCIQCAELFIEKWGYAYAPRTLQFRGVDFCPEHGTVLYTSALERRLPDATTYGLILPPDQGDWRTLLIPVKPLSESPAWRALGRWVNAVLTGDFPVISANARTELLQHRLAELPRENGDPSSPAGRLERHLIRTYGPQVFESLGIPIVTGVTGHWPTFLILGTAYTDHPLANLLVISALFDSPNEFVRRATDLQRVSDTVAEEASKPVTRPKGVAWTLSLIRDFYRESSIPAIARKRGNDHGTIESMLQLHPELPKRREKFLAWRERTRMRRVMKTFMSANPTATRTAAAGFSRSTFDWLMRHDRAWVEGQIPAKREARPSRSAKQDFALLDARTMRRLADAAHRHSSENGIERITKTFLVKALESNERTMLAAKKLPKSDSQIYSLIETREAHLRRVERILTGQIASRNIRQARQTAQAIVAAYGRQQDYVAKIINVMIQDPSDVDAMQAAA